MHCNRWLWETPIICTTYNSPYLNEASMSTFLLRFNGVTDFLSVIPNDRDLNEITLLVVQNVVFQEKNPLSY